MGDRYIWGVQLLVEDVPGAKKWLCENLFFVEEEPIHFHLYILCQPAFSVVFLFQPS